MDSFPSEGDRLLLASDAEAALRPATIPVAVLRRLLAARPPTRRRPPSADVRPAVRPKRLGVDRPPLGGEARRRLYADASAVRLSCSPMRPTPPAETAGVVQNADAVRAAPQHGRRPESHRPRATPRPLVLSRLVLAGPTVRLSPGGGETGLAMWLTLK